jgi:hypothetical protein
MTSDLINILNQEYAILENIDKEIKDLELKQMAIREKIRPIEYQLDALKREEDELVRIENFKDRDVYSIKIDDLRHISLPMAKKLMEIFYGVNQNEYYVFYTCGTERSKPMHLTGLNYRDQVIRHLFDTKRRRNYCNYCRSLFHTVDQCPTAKKCSACGSKGHSAKRCIQQ